VVKAFDIGAYVFIVRSPLVEVAKEQVMFAPPGGTQRDQVVGVKLQLRMKMERFNMVDLYFSTLVATGNTGRFTL
jgi:hypothetical protein